MGDRHQIIRRDYLYGTTVDPKGNVVKLILQFSFFNVPFGFQLGRMRQKLALSILSLALP